MRFSGVYVLALAATYAGLARALPAAEADHSRRQQATSDSGHKTVIAANGFPVRYKDTTGKLCESTPGVASYAGYVDLAEDKHTFFWFFAARNNPETAPTTLWLSGGPGVDGENGLFYGNGPCAINENVQPTLRNTSWNQHSNMIYIDQPFGVGFSYQSKAPGSLNSYGEVVPASMAPPNGIYPFFNRTLITSTADAAPFVWNAVQAIMSAVSKIDNKVKSNVLNLSGESYGGHWVPGCSMDYFYTQNEGIKNGSEKGMPLEFGTMTIVSGLIDAAIQYQYYVPFSVNNTYGLQLYDEAMITHANFALTMLNGCENYIALCRASNRTTSLEKQICTSAYDACRNPIELMYTFYTGRDQYDIRSAAGSKQGRPPITFINYLNLPEVQQGLGVGDLNYTNGNLEMIYLFQPSGDWILDFKPQIGRALDRGIKVVLMHGDADWICNWFGGEAVSLAIPHNGAEQFKAAGYAPFVVDGVEKGQTRQFGNLSFTRVYDAGHEVAVLQPEAAHALFYRGLLGLSVADDSAIAGDSGTSGPATASHSNTLPPWAPATIDSASIIAAAATAIPTAA